MASIAAGLIAILSFVAFLNGLLTWFGSLLFLEELTLQFIVGKIFMPVAWIMGVPFEVRTE